MTGYANFSPASESFAKITGRGLAVLPRAIAWVFLFFTPFEWARKMEVKIGEPSRPWEIRAIEKTGVLKTSCYLGGALVSCYAVAYGLSRIFEMAK